MLLGNFLEHSFMGELLGHDFNGYKRNAQACRLREKQDVRQETRDIEAT